MANLAQELRKGPGNSMALKPELDDYAKSIQRWTKPTEKEAV